ncbi:MAG: ADYC domain-containing protein [Myxococcota bacterium]
MEAGCRSDESGESCTLTRYRVVDTVLDIVVERGEDEPVSGSEDGPRRERATWLYRVEATRAAKPRPEDWDDACGDSEFGLFVAGGWDDDGRYDLNGFTFSCLDGAIAKCAYQWGYDPERAVVAEDGALTSLRAVHMACVRAVRADYCGDGTAHTRAGIPIAMTDGLGINTRSSEPDFRPEACFDPDGALWVARARLSNTAQVRGDWLELSNCRRPVQAADAADSVASRAVVCVASHPDG